MTPREAAKKCHDYASEYYAMPVDPEHDVRQFEQIIQAACDEATRVRWTKKNPTTPGKWHWRISKGHPSKVREVRLMGRELVVEHWTVASQGGEWSDKPIQEPE